MTAVKGLFAGRITKQSEISLTDQPNHGMSIAEVSGTQKSPDPLWNNGKITYWGVMDVLGAKGTQRGYFDNLHEDKGRDWGTFDGKVSMKNGAPTVAGTWKFAGGDGKYRGIRGGGKFKVTMKSETEVECKWSGDYKLRKSK